MDKVPVSDEVLDHIIEHDYDGQGKSRAQEARDTVSMLAIVFTFGGLWTIALIALIIMLVK